MKKINLANLLVFLTISTLSSCSVIGGIFKAGMGVGIFMVVAVVVIIAIIVMRVNKR